MKKHLVLLTLATTLFTSTLTTFALTPEQIKTQSTKQEAVKQASINYNANFIKQARTTKPFEYSILFTDTYGNILDAKTKYHGSGHSIGTRRDKAFTVKDTATREGYKPATLNVNATKEAKTTNVVLVPAKPNNIVMGKVEFPQGVDTKGWYIEVVKASDEDADTDDVKAEAYIKVKPDGTFEMLNLPNGDYVFTVVKGAVKPYVNPNSPASSNLKFNKESSFNREAVTVKGNLNKTIKLETQPFRFMTPNDLFAKIDYTSKDLYTITPDLQLSDTLKKAVDANVNNNKDMSTLKDIGKLIQTYFKEKPSNLSTGSTHDFNSVKQIEESNGLWLDDCGEYALVYSAIARYKGLPTVYVSTTNTDRLAQDYSDNTFGHKYLEILVGDKWVLVDSTEMAYLEDYDINDANVLSKCSGVPNGEYRYMYSKSVNASGTAVASKTASLMQNLLDKTFDFTLVNKDTKNIITE